MCLLIASYILCFTHGICCQYSTESVRSSENADAIAKKVKRICNVRKIGFTHDSKIEVCFIRLDADRE